MLLYGCRTLAFDKYHFLPVIVLDDTHVTNSRTNYNFGFLNIYNVKHINFLISYMYPISKRKASNHIRIKEKKIPEKEI